MPYEWPFFSVQLGKGCFINFYSEVLTLSSTLGLYGIEIFSFFIPYHRSLFQFSKSLKYHLKLCIFRF